VAQACIVIACSVNMHIFQDEEASALDTVLAFMLPTIVVLISLGLGATLTWVDVRKCCERWQGPLIPLLVQYGIMPCVGYGMALALNVPANVGLSYVVTTCCPGGTTSNIFTYFSGSDVTLSLVATGLSNLFAAIALPILIPFWSGFFVTSEGAIPITDVLISVCLVIIPCCCGIVVKANTDVWAKRLEKIAGGAGSISIAFTIIVGCVANWEYFLSSWQNYVAGLLFMPIGGTIGYNLAKLAGLPQKTCQACCFESGLQNALIGLTMLELAFGVESQVFTEASVFCYMYLFFIFIPHGFAMMFYFRSITPKEDEEEKAAELTNEGATA